MNTHPASPAQRVALIGCGFFAPNHIHAWKDLPGAALVAVCDLDEQRAKAAAALAGGVAYYTDPARLLDEQHPDVADIVTTAPSHLLLAKLCAGRRISAIIQKPLARDFAEAQAIAGLAHDARVPMMVHENFRFQRPIREVKSLLSSGAIGQPLYCRIAFRTGYDIYTGQPYLAKTDRFVLMDNGVHLLDVARFLMGEILGLSCQTQRVRPGIAGEDMACVLARFVSGAVGVIEGSYGSYLPDDPFPETLITVEGRTGSIVLDRHYQLSWRSGQGVQTYSAEPPCLAWAERPWHVVQESVLETCRHWLEAAAGRTALQTSVEDNLRTLAAVEACYRSAARGGALIMPPRCSATG